MSITDFIVDHLQQGKTVEIPGIGTFQRANGVTTFSQSFNNDKSIVQHIAEKECVSYSIAEMMWKNYVDALSDKLKETHSHELPSIGFINFDGTSYNIEQSAAPIPVKEEAASTLSNATIYQKDESDDPFAVFEQPIVEEPAKPEPIPEPQPVVEAKPEPVAEPEPAAEPKPIVEPKPEPVAKPAPKPVVEPEPVVVPAPEPVKPVAAAASVASVAKEADAEVIDNMNKLDNMPTTKGKKEEKKPAKKEEKKKKGGWIVILLLLLLLLLGGGGAYYYFKIYLPQHQAKVEPVVEQKDTTPEIELPIVIDSIESEPEEVIAQVAPAPKPKAEPVPTEKVVTKSKGAYDLIAGYYTSKSVAVQMMKVLKADGCAAYLIEKNGGYYVSMGHASSYTEAQAKLEHVKSWYEGDVVIKNVESATSMI